MKDYYSEKPFIGPNGASQGAAEAGVSLVTARGN